MIPRVQSFPVSGASVRLMRASLAIMVLLCGCDEPTAEPVAPPEAPEPELPDAEVEARLPDPGGPLAPALTRLADPHDARAGELASMEDVEMLADVARCAPCHQDVVATWSTSAHARSSFDNPWYRATVDSIREERGNESSRFCAGCHDPVLLVSGGMDAPVEPDDPRAHAGIPCLVCHSTTSSRSDGNGSYTLQLDPPAIPDPSNEAEIAIHVARMTPDPLRTAALCGSCHRSFLGPAMGSPNHLGGIDDIGAWKQSIHAGSRATRVDEPRETRDCVSCHMEPTAAVRGDLAATDGRISSHRVMASHTALGAQLGLHDSALVGAATIDVAAARIGDEVYLPAEAAPAEGAERIAFDVVVRNTEVGHAFPGGTRDLQDTWIEVTVRDGRGRVLAEAGTDHEDSPDESAFRLRSVLVDEEGRPEEEHRVHRFVAGIYDRTIAPRDALVVRYRADLPADVRPPLRIDARLRHRKHGDAIQRLACEATRSERGRAFARASRALHRVPLDGCREEPVTDVATARVVLGTATGPEAWPRLRDLALGLSHQVQERLDEGRVVITRARALAAEIDPHADGELRSILARIAARQGRLEETLELLAGVDPLPAARIRGEAYAQVWRWEDAAREFRTVAEGAPGDVVAWRDLARALGSMGDDAGSLDAVLHGLELGPRHPDLLRSQALAMGEDATAARDAFLAHRVPDDAPALLRRCQESVAGCDRDRQPVPTIVMRR